MPEFLFSRVERRLTPFVLALMAIGLFQLLALAYLPGFKAPFIYDDLPNIVYNEDFRQDNALGHILGTHPESTQYDKRPVSGVLTWLNYRLMGLNVSGYRAFNLFIHWACALAGGAVVFLMARRVMEREDPVRKPELRAMENSTEAPAAGLPATPRLFAVVTAVLWAMHPIHSTAVIYINQRQETLMTLFFLLSCLCLLMAGTPSRKPALWRLLSGLAALCCVLAKENGAGLIVVLAVIDRLFVAGSWEIMWRRHRVFWTGLAVAWAAILWWIATGVRLKEWDDIAALASPWAYFKTECRVVFNYLRLCLWPDPLIFAPVPKIAERWQDWLPYGLALCTVFGAIAIAALRRPWLWIPWLSALLILAPTSSFIPVPLEPDFDYRMHLPALALGVILLALLRGWIFRWNARGQNFLWLNLGGLIAVIATFAVLVGLRARDYTRTETIWLDTVRKEPANVKALLHLAHVLWTQKRYPEVEQVAAALRNVNGVLELPWVEAEYHKLLALLAAAADRWPEAGAEYAKASALLPERPDFAVGEAQSLLQQGKAPEALARLDNSRADRMKSDPAALLCRAQALLVLERREEALRTAAPVESLHTPSPEADAALAAWRKALTVSKQP